MTITDPLPPLAQAATIAAGHHVALPPPPPNRPLEADEAPVGPPPRSRPLPDSRPAFGRSRPVGADAVGSDPDGRHARTEPLRVIVDAATMPIARAGAR